MFGLAAAIGSAVITGKAVLEDVQEASTIAITCLCADYQEHVLNSDIFFHIKTVTRCFHLVWIKFLPFKLTQIIDSYKIMLKAQDATDEG